jgi:hypothetical protein
MCAFFVRRWSDRHNSFAVQHWKQYFCNRPDLFYENYALALLIPSLFFFSSCNNTKAADGKKVVTVDAVEERQAINIITLLTIMDAGFKQ